MRNGLPRCVQIKIKTKIQRGDRKHMAVQSYSFGRIVINGKAYTSDVIVGRDFVKEGWWRKEGHRVSVDDIGDILKAEPEVVIFGTGANGRLRVDEKVKELLKARGIEVYEYETAKAAEVFNEMLRKGRNAVLAAHLTC